MYYSTSYFGERTETQQFIPVFGNYVGFYLLEETVEPLDYNTISDATLFSGETKVGSGNIVTLSANNKQYSIAQRRVQAFPNWLFNPGAFVFFGLQHDHYYVMDYQQAAWYKDHDFANLEAWFMNQHFTPVFGMFIDQQRSDPRDYDIILFEHKDQVRNPLLDYTNITSVDHVDNVYHAMTYCVEQVTPTVVQDNDFVKVRFTMNKTYLGQHVYIKPLVNVPVMNDIELDARGTGEVIYRKSSLYGNTISFDVYPSAISAGRITVGLTNV